MTLQWPAPGSQGFFSQSDIRFQFSKTINGELWGSVIQIDWIDVEGDQPSDQAVLDNVITPIHDALQNAGWTVTVTQTGVVSSRTLEDV